MVKVQCGKVVRSSVFFGVIQRVTGSLGAIATLLLLAPAVDAEAVLDAVNTGEPMTEAIAPLSLSDLDQPATTVAEWIAQIEASLVQITAVRVEATETGLQIILETAAGELSIPATRTVGNALIADIANATLAEEFSQAEPIAGIALVEVTQLPGDRVRVAITGTDAPPVAEVRSEGQGLLLGVAIGQAGTGAADDAIQVVVTGEQDEGYNPSNASTATRTDTPLRDIPQSITVVPRQVLDDRNVQGELEALETVSGVIDAGTVGIFPGATDVAIRGFSNNRSGRLRDGLPSEAYITFTPIGVIEQVEVLRGPASVLFGALEPGGVINYVTRQPLAEPYYSVELEVGNYGFYQPSIDLSGPLTEDGNILYRLIAAYQGGREYDDRIFTQEQTISITPSITFRFGERTSLNFYYEYGTNDSNNTLEPLLSDGSLIPRDVTPYYFGVTNIENQRFGYTLNHEFNDSWQLRHNLAATFGTIQNRAIEYGGLSDDRFLTDFFAFDFEQSIDRYVGLIDVVGEFNTGSISHQLVAGFDFNREVSYFGFNGNPVDLPPLDIFDPDYDVSLPEIPSAQFTNLEISQAYGVYLQDQIAFTDNLRMLIGGRYDWVSSDTGLVDEDRAIQADGAFSPRIGLVYQPSQNVSLYASYSQSFRPSIGRNPDNEPFDPTRGTQYEIGVKADFLDGRLSTTLAAYNLTRSNVLTPDPDPDRARQGFQVQVGEQRSQGIELDVAGEILPGWNIVAAYALTDAEVTADNSTPSTVGNRLLGIPEHQASIWTTYIIQDGSLQGLGFGLGLFYVGERQGDLANSFQLGDYLRTDAALYYRRGRFNAAINVRNLFNIDYVSSPNFGPLFVNRADPLTVTGSVSWEF